MRIGLPLVLLAAPALSQVSTPAEGLLALNGPLVPGGDVIDMQVDPTGSFVVYKADAQVDNEFELYSVDLHDPAAPVRLNGDLVPGGRVWSYRFSDDGQWVLYGAEQDHLGRADLWRAPVDGSAPAVKLNLPLTEDGMNAFVVQTQGDWVVYRSDNEVEGRADLWSVPLDQSAPPVRLNHVATNVGDVVEHYIDPTGTRVIYRADHYVAGQWDLWSVPIDGSLAPVRLLDPPSADGSVWESTVSTDGTTVFFSSSHLVETNPHMYAVPIDGSQPPIQLTPPTPQYAAAHDLAYDEFSGRILFRIGLTNAGQNDLCSCLPDGSDLQVINPPITFFSGDVYGYVIAPGGRVAFWGTVESPQSELFFSTTDGVGPVQEMITGLSLGQDVIGAYLESSGEWLVARADLTKNWSFENYGMRIDGTTTPVKLGRTPVKDGNTKGPTSDFEGHVVFFGDVFEDEKNEAFLSHVSGGGIQRVAGGIPAYADVGDVLLVGNRAVFTSDHEVDGVVELYLTVPLFR